MSVPRVFTMEFGQSSAACRVLLGDVDITHFLSLVSVSVKAGGLTQVELGIRPASLVYLKALVPDAQIVLRPRGDDAEQATEERGCSSGAES